MQCALFSHEALSHQQEERGGKDSMKIDWSSSVIADGQRRWTGYFEWKFQIGTELSKKYSGERATGHDSKEQRFTLVVRRLTAWPARQKT